MKSTEQIAEAIQEVGAGTEEQAVDQTNLLALNAAIEAARAGERGRSIGSVTIGNHSCRANECQFT